MRRLKKGIGMSIINSYIITSPLPSNISYNYNYGSMLGSIMGIQIVSGILVGINYIPTIELGFISITHIMRNINNGSIIRYIHSNTASILFIVIYLHIIRSIYYASYRKIKVYTSGYIIYILVMAIAFIGYILPVGQMSIYGATVILSMLTSIPGIGKEILIYISGDNNISNNTIKRMYVVHIVLPIISISIIIIHLIMLHNIGSSNIVGITSNTDRIAFNPYYSIKDIITIIIVIISIIVIITIKPRYTMHSDNNIEANPLVTPRL
jgi:ubiquinol-cytochrome c reductase cytochrome b subunit